MDENGGNSSGHLLLNQWMVRYSLYALNGSGQLNSKRIRRVLKMNEEFGIQKRSPVMRISTAFNTVMVVN